MSNSYDQMQQQQYTNAVSPVPLSATANSTGGMQTGGKPAQHQQMGLQQTGALSPTQMLNRIKEYMSFSEQNRSVSPGSGATLSGGKKKNVDDVLKRLANKRNEDGSPANSRERGQSKE